MWKERVTLTLYGYTDYMADKLMFCIYSLAEGRAGSQQPAAGWAEEMELLGVTSYLLSSPHTSGPAEEVMPPAISSHTLMEIMNQNIFPLIPF